MTKTELYTNVNELMVQFEEQFKSKKQFDLFKSEVDKLLKPKSGGGVTKFEPIIKDGITYHRCRYTELYLPEDEMVMSKGKSKGYSKKAIAKWTKAGKEVEAINAEAMKLLLAGDTENGTIKAQKAEELKQLRNKSEYYKDIVDEYKDIALDQE